MAAMCAVRPSGADTRRLRSTGSDRGFTLLEVSIALLLLASMALGAAQLFTVVIRMTSAARHQTSAALLAVQKMEQLRALTWAIAANGIDLLSDTSTNLAVEPPTSAGPGLAPSPADSLSANTPGYVDFLDARGQHVGTGVTPPPAAVYIRRWNIQPAPADPMNMLVLQVLVTTVVRDAQLVSGPGPRRRHADEALIATVRSRQVR